LYLYDNQLTTLPSEIGNLQKLKKLYLWQNQLTTLPEEIKNLQNLKELYLGGNNFSATEKERIKSLLPNCTIDWEKTSW